MSKNKDPKELSGQDFERLLPSIDDSWSVFAVDLVESRTAEAQGAVGLWAGTNSPIINEILGQKAREHAYPYEPEQLGLIPAGHNGLYFMMSQSIFDDEEERKKIIDSLGKEAQETAKEQGYDLEVLGDMTEQKGIIQRALRTTANMRKLGPEALGLEYSGEEEEES